MYIEQDNKEFDKIIGTVRLVLSLCENHSLIFSFVQKVADVEFKYLGEAKQTRVQSDLAAQQTIIFID